MTKRLLDELLDRACNALALELLSAAVIFGSAPMVFAGLKPDVAVDLDLFVPADCYRKILNAGFAEDLDERSLPRIMVAPAVEVVMVWPGVEFEDVWAASRAEPGSRGLRVAALKHVLAFKAGSTRAKDQEEAEVIRRALSPNSWRLEFLSTLSDRTVEEREYILRTLILISQLNDGLAWLMDDVPAHRAERDRYLEDYKADVDRIWHDAHRADRARDSAMTLCRALAWSHDPAHARVLLQVNGHVRLADALEDAELQCAWETWHDGSRGMKVGRISKYERVARLVRKLGLKVSQVTIKSLWANNRGYRRRQRGTVRRPSSASSPPQVHIRIGADGIPRPE